MTGPSTPPAWLQQTEQRLLADPPEWFTRFAPPADAERRAAVLMLLGEGDDGRVDIVLTERSARLRSHAGQVSFPGGGLDPGETPEQAALREAWEEVGVEPDSVDVLASFPGLYLSPSRNAVTPVLGWWREPGELGVVDPGEVARVVRVPIEELVDPERRFTVTGPSGYSGPGFDVADLFVWGFTAQLLAVLLDAAGQSRPWDESVRRRLPMRYVLPYLKPGGRR